MLNEGFDAAGRSHHQRWATGSKLGDLLSFCSSAPSWSTHTHPFSFLPPPSPARSSCSLRVVARTPSTTRLLCVCVCVSAGRVQKLLLASHHHPVCIVYTRIDAGGYVMAI